MHHMEKMTWASSFASGDSCGGSWPLSRALSLWSPAAAMLLKKLPMGMQIKCSHSTHLIATIFERWRSNYPRYQLMISSHVEGTPTPYPWAEGAWWTMEATGQAHPGTCLARTSLALREGSKCHRKQLGYSQLSSGQTFSTTISGTLKLSVPRIWDRSHSTLSQQGRELFKHFFFFFSKAKKINEKSTDQIHT